MLERWRNKVKGLFEKNQPEDMDEFNESKDKIQTIQAKMKYEYPNKTPFRFPVIPDSTEKNSTLDTPAYQRKGEERDWGQRETKVDLGKEQREEKSRLTNNERKRPFTPSQVPSPIYGYQKRKKAKDIENIPTFVRKQQTEYLNKKESIKNKIADPGETKKEVIKNNEQPINQGDSALKISDVTTESKRTESNQERVATKQSKRKHSRQRKRNDRRQQKKYQKQQVNPVPFNVMMTPKDKRSLHKKKNSKKPSIKTDNKEEINTHNLPKQKSDSIPYYLLNDPEEETSEDRQWVRNQQELLEKTLKHFNVRAKVVNATQGPSVTRFEVQPELGVKVSKIRNLSDDIKMNMSAKDIRIEAPIPGKNTIGIEVPNLNSQMVGLQEILETDSFQQSASPLTIGLGLTVEGLPLITNISKMPHGLIAGATGSGKSVCINTILISLLYKSSYEDVKFLLIDPKMVELAPYNGIPHLVSPVITDVKAATLALKWAVNEMEDRYEKFVQEGVRDISRFNEKVTKQNRLHEKMPFIVIVIDELADLMMASPQDVEDAICRIAQKARACGMHLLVATQRPSVDVITGLIKANIPTRIAFSVSSQVDSRTIIDTNGAERLLGKGDMLFIENGSGKSIRLQGAFVSDAEIERVTSHLRSLSDPDYLFEQDQLLKQIEMDEDEDEILDEVIQFVFEQNSASTSLLQRQFRIGYNRAARLIDTLEARGIISGPNGSKPREVLLSKTQLEEMIQ